MTCRQCKKPVTFNTWSELRTHQWALHGDTYRKAKARDLKITKFRCKHCNHVSTGRRAMMKHAWKHKDVMMSNNRYHSKELVPLVKTVRDLRTNGTQTLEANPVLNTEMTAIELLNKLNGQRDFMISVTKLIEGMLMK